MKQPTADHNPWTDDLREQFSAWAKRTGMSGYFTDSASVMQIGDAWLDARTRPPKVAGPVFVNAEIVLLCGIAKEARREHDASDGHFSTEEVLLLERIARFPAVCETVEGGAARVEVREIAVRDAPDARQVWLINGGQSFTVGDYWDDPEDAEMYAKCLRHAIRTPAPPMDSLPRYASAKTLRDKHPEMSHLHTEEPAHPSDTSAEGKVYCWNCQDYVPKDEAESHLQSHVDDGIEAIESDNDTSADRRDAESEPESGDWRDM